MVGEPGDCAWAPLLNSKLAVPAPPGMLVERPRLHRLLDAGAHCLVTLVAAPAGWGKTALLSSWVRAGHPGRPIAWLSIEPGDDGERFWSYLHAALDSAGVGRNDEGAVLPAPAPDSMFLACLADALARSPWPVVVVLDDFHHVCDADVLRGLDYLLRHAAGGLRLVIGTRADPALPLHRWRLHGDIVELRTGELAFTAEETAELLAQHGLALPAGQLDQLQDQTEGWPAGVRLSALSIQDNVLPARLSEQFAAYDPRIAHYLITEVLSPQPDDIQDLLVSTSILERSYGGLVEALTDRTDGEAILAELERTNAFVVSLGTRPCSYRYHRMFGVVLRAELRRRTPERIPELHRRAAEWHVAHGLSVEALRHALAGRDWTCATQILVDAWPALVLCPGYEAHCRIVPAPPADAVQADPELALAVAAGYLGLHDLTSADDYLRLADVHKLRLDGECRARFDLMAAGLRLAAALSKSDTTQVQSIASRMLGMVAHDDGTGTAVALTALGTAQLSGGQLAIAESTLEDGLARALRVGLTCPSLLCASGLAFVQAALGRLRAAERTAREALAMPPCPNRSPLVHCAHAYLALAIVDIERDRPADAQSNLDLAAHAYDPMSEPGLSASITVVRAQLLLEQGRLAEGCEVLLAGRRDLGGWEPSPDMEQWFAAVGADLRTYGGDTETARRSLAPLMGETGDMPTRLAVALARSYLRDDDPCAASRVLPDWAENATGEPLVLRLDAGFLEAMTARLSGDARHASGLLERVLHLAEPEGFNRVFTHAGPHARDLLLDHLDSGTAYWSMVSDLIAATDGKPTPSDLPSPPDVSEPLTDRELTVLRYLQSILSNVEIAAELSLSVNTVKTHVRNIYRKLDTTRRGDTVRKARELHLL